MELVAAARERGRNPPEVAGTLDWKGTGIGIENLGMRFELGGEVAEEELKDVVAGTYYY